MKKVFAKGDVVRGIDIYHGNMISDVTKLKPWGIQYAFLKAFELSKDLKFESRWKSLKEHGIIRGAYAFFHPGRDPIFQAQSFLNVVGTFEETDLPPVLDWETTDHVPSTIDKERALKWLTVVRDLSQKVPIIYTSPYFADALRLDVRFQDYGLWIAHYGVNAPLIPSPWNTWNFWQTSESASVPGIEGHSDLDFFNGNLSELHDFIMKSNIGATS
jgi:lysozyme